MSTKRGKNRSSGAVSDKRSNDKKGSPESSKSESEKPELPLEYEWETEDGLKVSLSPDEAEISREYQLSENDFVEFSAGIDISPLDWRVEKTGDDASVSGEVSLPGDILGLSGGISVDLSTGEITGGELGVEAGAVGVEVSVSGQDGCQKSLSVSVLGFGISYTRDDCEPEEKKEEVGRDEKEPQRDPRQFSEDQMGELGVIADRYSHCNLTSIFARTLEYYKKSSEEEQDLLVVTAGGNGKTPPPENMEYSTVGNISVYHSSTTGNSFTRYGYIDITEGGRPRLYTFEPRLDSIYIEGRPGTNKNYQEVGYGSLYKSQVILFYIYYRPPFTKAVRDFVTNSENKLGFSHILIRNCRGGEVFGGNKPEYRRRIPPAPPPKRIMNDCCRTSTKLMREIHQALGCRELIDKGLKVPNRWIVSGGKRSTKLTDYLEIAVWQMRMADHLGIHPFVAKVTDANAAQAGDQSVEMEFANATAAAKQIAELLLENKGDSATRLNLMMRTAIATGQILNVVSIVAKNVENLINFVGMPIQEKVKLVKMPFDFTFGKRKEQNGKGFGTQSNASQSGIDALDINTEEATEALLPKFMQDEQQPIVYKQFKPKQPGLIDIIRGKK